MSPVNAASHFGQQLAQVVHCPPKELTAEGSKLHSGPEVCEREGREGLLLVHLSSLEEHIEPSRDDGQCLETG